MSNRISQINELIKRELGRLLLTEINFPPKTLVTITRVECSSNRIQAKVYISVNPDKKRSSVLKTLNQNISSLQDTLNSRLDMRPVPKIIFVPEKKVKQAAEIERLIKKVHRIEKNKDNGNLN